MKQVLVTGGAGFIGSHMCERILQEGDSVICLDNLSTGKQDNVAHLDKYGDRFEFIEWDVTHSLSQIHKKICNVDIVFNMACPASPVHYQRDPIKTCETSVIGMMNILRLADHVQKAAGKKIRVIQASTSEIYGDPLQHPQSESYFGNVNTLGPRACYDEGKRLAETLCADYKRTRQVDVGIVRIFNTYGPKMAHDDGRVVSNFIVQALRNEPLTVYGDGLQTRSFCYVSDMVEGLLRMGYHQIMGPINLGNPNELFIANLAEKVIAKTGSSSVIEYNDLPADDPKIRRPSIDAATWHLNWKPKVSLDEGLDSTIEYFRNTL